MSQTCQCPWCANLHASQLQFLTHYSAACGEQPPITEVQ